VAVAVLDSPRSRARAALVAMRPRQWSKNLLLFAGLLFAAKLGDETRWLEALLAFALYCAASSAAYLVNDVRDAVQDRQHPIKRFRPVASGELSVRRSPSPACSAPSPSPAPRSSASGRSGSSSGSSCCRPPTRPG
jgi:heme O synthase-like polyprenyltransferase